MFLKMVLAETIRDPEGLMMILVTYYHRVFPNGKDWHLRAVQFLMHQMQPHQMLREFVDKWIPPSFGPITQAQRALDTRPELCRVGCRRPDLVGSFLTTCLQ